MGLGMVHIQNRKSFIISDAIVPKTILIVEDDLEIRVILTEFLSELGYEAYSANNGQNALSLLPKISKPSLILLDLMMPVMNGWDFANKLSQMSDFNEIPIVVMTAIPCEVEGGNVKRVLRKPLNINQLLSVVESYFEPKN